MQDNIKVIPKQGNDKFGQNPILLFISQGDMLMNELDAVKKEINQIKKHLNCLTEDNKELSSQDILTVSKKLDELINLYNKLSAQAETKQV